MIEEVRVIVKRLPVVGRKDDERLVKESALTQSLEEVPEVVIGPRHASRVLSDHGVRLDEGGASVVPQASRKALLGRIPPTAGGQPARLIHEVLANDLERVRRRIRRLTGGRVHAAKRCRHRVGRMYVEVVQKEEQSIVALQLAAVQPAQHCVVHLGGRALIDALPHVLSQREIGVVGVEPLVKHHVGIERGSSHESRRRKAVCPEDLGQHLVHLRHLVAISRYPVAVRVLAREERSVRG